MFTSLGLGIESSALKMQGSKLHFQVSGSWLRQSTAV